MENTPSLWKKHVPDKSKTPNAHKYDYGYAAIYAAPELTGATRLAAEACARMGVGLVTVITPPKTASVYKTTLPPHIMVRVRPRWRHDKISARLYGSGGLSTKPDFRKDIPTVYDADALKRLPKTLPPNAVITPHAGEFLKAFPKLRADNSEKALTVAREKRTVVVLKTVQTIIACPDGRLAINKHTSPWLATAGSGDILAGMITGLIAQSIPSFEAACMAVWIHGECARKLGAGLVAYDLIKEIPKVLADLT